jgi:CheY-like chemotaxis protein
MSATLTESQRDADVVITDLAMPDADGYALLTQLLGTPALAGIPVVAYSAYASLEDRQRALAAGFSAYFGKPVDIDALTTTLVTMLSG